MNEEKLQAGLEFVGSMKSLLTSLNQDDRVLYPRHFYVLITAKILDEKLNFYSVSNIREHLESSGILLQYETVQKAVKDLRIMGYLEKLNPEDHKFIQYKFALSAIGKQSLLGFQE